MFVQADLTTRSVELVDSCHEEIEEAKRHNHNLSVMLDCNQSIPLHIVRSFYAAVVAEGGKSCSVANCDHRQIYKQVTGSELACHRQVLLQTSIDGFLFVLRTHT